MEDPDAGDTATARDRHDHSRPSRDLNGRRSRCPSLRTEWTPLTIFANWLLKDCWIFFQGPIKIQPYQREIVLLSDRRGCWMRSVILGLLGGMAAMVGPGRPAVEAGERPPVTFERDVEPILTRAGCNAGACHGKARGQNGFALSLLGFDPAHDYEAIVKEAGGRRVSRLMPADSLLLGKATARLPHGGGLRLAPGTSGYETVLRWIAAGMPRTPSDAPRVERIAVEPTERTLKRAESFALRVTAHYHRRVGRGRDGAGRVRLERVGPGQGRRRRPGHRRARSRAMRPSRRGSPACSPTAT